jgi:hypothetical protein
MVSGRSAASVCSASPSRISTRSIEAAGLQVGAGARHLGRLELGGDQAAAAVVAQGRGQVQGRDAERGPELDDRARAAAARQHVEQRAGLARDGSGTSFRRP